LTAKRQLLEPPSPTEKATTTTATPSPRLFPSSPLGGTFDIQGEVERAVAKLLPNVVLAALADMLTGQLAVPTSSPSPRVTPAPPNLMSSLNRLISTQLTTHADKVTQEVTDICDTAEAEVGEQLEEHRLEFTVLKEDGLFEINELCDAKLQGLSDHIAELVESARTDIENVYLLAKDRLDESYEETMTLTRVKELLRCMLERRQSSARQQLRRVSSSPL
jgi:hypothetical protein